MQTTEPQFSVTNVWVRAKQFSVPPVWGWIIGISTCLLVGILSMSIVQNSSNKHIRTMEEETAIRVKDIERIQNSPYISPEGKKAILEEMTRKRGAGYTNTTSPLPTR